MKAKRIAACAAALALSAALLSGCTLIHFEDPGEAKKKEEDSQALAIQTVQVDPRELLGEDMTYQQELRTDSGVTLATYSAALPKFQTDGAKGAVFTKLNEFYAEELKQLPDDCARFFATVQERYGENWKAVTEAAQVESSAFTYELLDAPAAYISIVRTYTSVGSDGGQSSYYFADVFGGETGWKLKMTDLFGMDGDKAVAAMRGALEDWCAAQGLERTAADAVDDDTLSAELAISSQGLVFAIPPYAVSPDDPQGHLITVPMSQVRELLAAQ